MSRIDESWKRKFESTARMGGRMRDNEQGDSEEQFMSEFFTKVSTVKRKVNLGNEHVKGIKQTHEKIISSPVASKTRTQFNEELKHLRKEFLVLMKCIGILLKEINGWVISYEKIDPSSAEARISKAQYAQWLRKYKKTVEECDSIEVFYEQKYDHLNKRSQQARSASISHSACERSVETGNASGFTLIKTNSYKDAKGLLDAKRAQKSELDALERMLKELHDLMARMALALDKHAETMDIIEYNTKCNKNEVEDSLVYLKHSLLLQKSTRKAQIFSGIGVAGGATLATLPILL